MRVFHKRAVQRVGPHRARHQGAGAPQRGSAPLVGLPRTRRHLQNTLVCAITAVYSAQGNLYLTDLSVVISIFSKLL